MEKRSAPWTQMQIAAALGVGRLAEYFSSPKHQLGLRRTFRLARISDATKLQLIEIVGLVACGILGFWGFYELNEAKQLELPVITLLYLTLQLCVVQFPRFLNELDVNLQLQIARFLLPVLTASASLLAIVQASGRPLELWRLRRLRGHTIVIGRTSFSAALAKAYVDAGQKTVIIQDGASDAEQQALRESGAFILAGDASDPAVLRSGGISTADTLVSPNEPGGLTLRIISGVLTSIRGRPRSFGHLRLRMRQEDNSKTSTLLANSISEAVAGSNVSIRLYHPEAVIVRRLLAKYPADWGLPIPPRDSREKFPDLHIVIVGCGSVGKEILLQQVRGSIPRDGARLNISIVDTQVAELEVRIDREFPGLKTCCSINWVQRDVLDGGVGLDLTSATSVYISCGDDEKNLAIALELLKCASQKGDAPPPLFIRQRQGNLLVDSLARLHGHAVQTLRCIGFGSEAEELNPFFMDLEAIDPIAEVIHDAYLARFGDPKEVTTNSAKPWSELSEEYRTSNRFQALHYIEKLRALRWHVTPEKPDTKPQVEESLAEELAQSEHERWQRERWLDGWTLGPTRDEVHKKHPNLVPYGSLDRETKDKDLKPIQTLVDTLARVALFPREDYRVGIVFTAGNADQLKQFSKVSASTLALDSTNSSRVVQAIEECISKRPDAHFQLVCSLASDQEFVIIRGLLGRHTIGLEVVLVRDPSNHFAIGDSMDFSIVHHAILCADRAYVVDITDLNDTTRVRRISEHCDHLIIANESPRDRRS